MSLIARHVRVTGRVQGVFFRAWTREQAMEIGVSGWVRNCSDGSVEAMIEGDPEGVEALVDRMRRGPQPARVDGAKVSGAEPEGLSGFEVRR